MLISTDTLLTGRELLRPGWVDIVGGVVRASGAGDPPRRADHRLRSMTVVPGFVDTHVHGGAGTGFSTTSASDIGTAAGLHLRHGTTTLVASLVSDRPDELLRQVGALTAAVDAGVVAGIHLEGPWLAASRCGAHDRSVLRDPDPDELGRVLSLGGGAVRMVTLAPERTGGLDAVRRIVDAGAVAAVGHTEATYEQTRSAIAAGATVGTHLFNAMRPIHPREPGPVVALLEDPRVSVELIADGVHIHPALHREVCRRAGPDRVSLVTDAMAAAGTTDGAYRLGPIAVEVADGTARVAGTDTIAGSTATMDRVFRFAVAHSGLPRDDALLLAVRLTAVNPARALGLPEVCLGAGANADLVVFDSALAVAGVMRGGSWIIEPERGPATAASPQ